MLEGKDLILGFRFRVMGGGRGGSMSKMESVMMPMAAFSLCCIVAYIYTLSYGAMEREK